jgi:hypothetical protein
VLLGVEPVAADAGRLKQNGPGGAACFECAGSGGVLLRLEEDPDERDLVEVELR